MKFSALIPELYVADFPRSLHFYTEVLGFELEYRREAPLFAFLSYHSAQLMLQQQEPMDSHPGPLEYPYGRGMNLEISTPDVTGLLARLQRHNYSAIKDIEDCWRAIAGGLLSGSREIQVLDPDGYLLRFAQPLGTKPPPP